MRVYFKWKRAVSATKLSDMQFLSFKSSGGKKSPATARAAPAQKGPTAGMWTRGKCVLVRNRLSLARRAPKILKDDLY